jgi:hypothetical protein
MLEAELMERDRWARDDLLAENCVWSDRRD